MQENLKLFEKIPYKTRALKGTPLIVAHAQEALQDVLNDKSAFFKMPELSDIVGVSSESVYGVDKLTVTLREGVSHPEYMLNARVAELEPKLVNVIFETGEFVQETQESLQEQKPTQGESAEAPKSQNSDRAKDISLLTLTCSKLNLSYPEFATLIGYEAQDVLSVLSRGDIPAPMRRAIELYLENLQLKKELEESLKIKAMLKEWVA